MLFVGLLSISLMSVGMLSGGVLPVGLLACCSCPAACWHVVQLHVGLLACWLVGLLSGSLVFLACWLVGLLHVGLLACWPVKGSLGAVTVCIVIGKRVLVALGRTSS